MNLTPEQQEIGRRNFLKIAAGLPALAGLGTAAAMKGPLHGGPVRVGFIGVGGEGRVLLAQVDAAFAEVVAMADINPTQLARADEVLQKTKKPAAKHYVEWKDMIQQEKLEAVIIAVPLWAHPDVTVGCLDAGLHVLCEKMMAWDEAGCQRMLQASIKNNRLLEIGYQRFYNPVYQAAYSGIIKAGVLGDIYHSRIVWHRNGTWRRKRGSAVAHLRPVEVGLSDVRSPDQLASVHNKYSRGLLAELASHQLNVTNWFFDSTPTAVIGYGRCVSLPRRRARAARSRVHRVDYPGGRTAQFSSIESNALIAIPETFFGTKEYADHARRDGGVSLRRGERRLAARDEHRGDAARQRPHARSVGEPRRGRRRPSADRISPRADSDRAVVVVSERDLRLLRIRMDGGAARVRRGTCIAFGDCVHPCVGSGRQEGSHRDSSARRRVSYEDDVETDSQSRGRFDADSQSQIRRDSGQEDSDEQKDRNKQKDRDEKTATETQDTGMPIAIPKGTHHRTKQEFVYQTPRSAIMRCDLGPGERLVIDDLAKRLGVSIIPVREALQMLQSEALVVLVPHVGATVATHFERLHRRRLHHAGGTGDGRDAARRRTRHARRSVAADHARPRYGRHDEARELRGVGRPQHALPPDHRPHSRARDARGNDGARAHVLGPRAPLLLQGRARPSPRSGAAVLRTRQARPHWRCRLRTDW